MGGKLPTAVAEKETTVSWFAQLLSVGDHRKKILSYTPYPL